MRCQIRPDRRARLPFTSQYMIPNLHQTQRNAAKHKEKKSYTKKSSVLARQCQPNRADLRAPPARGLRSRGPKPSENAQQHQRQADLGARVSQPRPENSNEKTGGTARRCSHPSRSSTAGSNGRNMSIKKNNRGEESSNPNLPWVRGCGARARWTRVVSMRERRWGGGVDGGARRLGELGGVI